MSLNGLDNPVVQEAYQATIAEPGGWLLLKYITRDSVDLLGCGKNGVHEARAVVAKYPDPSPLYGVIIYRRRKILLKYLPPGTSRVLLARTAVHFQDVIEKYSPYEALLNPTSAEELTDTALASSFPLHTATPSGASSNRLGEITEDGEDPPLSRSLTSEETRLGASSPLAQRYRGFNRVEQRVPSVRSPMSELDPAAQSVRLPSSPILPSKTSVSQYLVRNESGKPSITSLGSDSLASMTEYDATESSAKDAKSSMSTLDSTSTVSPVLQAPSIQSSTSGSHMMQELQRRNPTELRPSTGALRQSTDRSSLSTRPTTGAHSSYDADLLDFLKPKVKLGPRPVAAGERTKQPPIAAVPASYRLSMRRQDPVPPSPQGRNLTPSTPLSSFPSPPPIPDTPEYSPRPLSGGSIKSLPSHRSTAMTPDKLRLMKAVELRKRQLRKSNPQAATFVPPPEEEVPAVPRMPEPAPMPDHIAPVELPAEDLVSTGIAQTSASALATGKVDSGVQMVVATQSGKEVTPGSLETYVQPPIEEEPVAPEIPEPEEPMVARSVDELPIQTHASEESASAEPQRLLAEPAQPLPEPSPVLDIPGSFLFPASPESEADDPIAHSDIAAEQAVEREKSPAEPEGSHPVNANDAPALETQLEVADIPAIVLADGTRPMTPASQPKDTEVARSIHSDKGGSLHSDSASSSGEFDAFEMSPKRKNSDLARRRQGYVEPIPVDTETESMSDDELEEVQFATLLQAKPITVSKSSPIHEFFPKQRRPSNSNTLDSLVTNEPGQVYAPSSLTTDTPVDGQTASSERRNEVPATYRPRGSIDRNDAPVGVKRSVSNEISKRIQALAGSSNTSPRSRSPDASAPSRGSVRTPGHSRNPSFVAIPSRNPSRLNAAQNQFTTPNGFSPPIQATPVWSVHRDPLTNRESVTVSSRIVRNATQDPEANSIPEHEIVPSPTQLTHLRDASTSAPSSPNLHRTSPDPVPSAAAPKRASGAPTTASSTFSGTSRAGSRMSMFSNSQKAMPSPTAEDFPPPPQSTRSSAMGVRNSAYDENGAPKEGSRTTRFFKRMSNIGGKRRSAMQQVPEGGSNAAVSNSATPITTAGGNILPAVSVGDLNIQFPDSLLWKRRTVLIDEHGQIKFTLSSSSPNSRPGTALGTRSFPLTAFKAPFVPDTDRMELPNSIMLDFVREATTLQLACEDTVSHIHVCHVLRMYWRAWNGVAGRE
ncbi:hypothetical protein BDY17DRAFT_291404 [Neohortaea acidophila]|uniref:ADF-H domain-containing protein n=1 Tax=Neohortaea acidophila TaxID=245834 RepID=A0A6A6Q359_9PEZI|nr:uncharacterized protein BDY17DRAFT_291404 [Neohortaea acidophila]KAF2486386.1 hypothetical protein BDY17DRAFT_291404 [Neohortaea acidophila]